MQHCHNMEAVDCTFRDILNNSKKPFSGLSVVFGEDFALEKKNSSYSYLFPSYPQNKRNKM